MGASGNDADRKTVSTSKGALALELLGKLPGEGNVFFSPESLAIALGMTALGARAKTLEAFERVLHVPKALGFDRFHAAVDSGAAGEGKGFVLSSANRLFGQKGFPFRAAFKEKAASLYSGGLDEVDFKTASAAARETINAWVSRATREKIPEILPPRLPTPDSRLVLVNAVHFKATWDEPFEERLTKDAPFHVTASRSVTAKLMRKNEHLPYAEDESCQLVAIPYEGGRFEGVFVLPKKLELTAFTNALTIEKLESLRARATGARVMVDVPRFKIEWGRDLAPELQEIGLAPAFSMADADFSAMADAPKEPLYLGSVIHRALVAVDEVGTEAAAATVVGVRAGGVPPKPVAFRADRPFLFSIRDTKTGSIIFLGRIVDPTGA